MGLVGRIQRRKTYIRCDIDGCKNEEEIPGLRGDVPYRWAKVSLGSLECNLCPKHTKKFVKEDMNLDFGYGE